MVGFSDICFDTFAPDGRFLDNWMLVCCDNCFDTAALFTDLIRFGAVKWAESSIQARTGGNSSFHFVHCSRSLGVISCPIIK